MELHKALDPKTNSLISASAGTGKTWMLVSRMLRLLIEGEDPGSILAITFTNKASTEMRERLMQRLLAMSFADSEALDVALQEIGISDKNTLPVYRQRVEQLYESVLHAPYPVQVTTFHSFCEQIISMFPLHTPEAHFQIASDTGEFIRQALNRMFEQATADSNGTLAQALSVLMEECEGIHNTQQALSQFLHNNIQWLAYLEDLAQHHITPEQDLRELIGFKDSDHNALQDFWSESMRQDLQGYGELIMDIGSDAQKKHAQSALDIAQEKHLNKKTFHLLKESVLRKSGNPRWQRVPKKGSHIDAFTHLADITLELSQRIAATQQSILRISNFRLNRALYTVGATALELYQTIKAENSVVDFNDLEWTARNILRRDVNGGQQLQHRLNTRIKHILVDEFQDTNTNQWELLRPLLDEIASQETGSVFIVGDSKQSIYGFRGANPKLQRKAQEWVVKNQNGRHLTMEKSRRSSPVIIDFVNALFQNLQQQNVLSMEDYLPHDTWQTSKGGVYMLDLLPKEETPAPVEWRNPLRAPLHNPRRSVVDEAERIAATIAAMRRDGLAIEEDGKERPFQYSDALILSRAAINFSHFKAALRRYAIPFSIANDINPFDSFEVQDVCALLEFLHDPSRNDLLTRVLRSPLFSFSDKDVFMLSSKPQKSHWLHSLNDAKPHWREAYQHLKLWVDHYGRLPTHDLLDLIYDQTDIIARYLSASDISREDVIRDNLNALLDEALDYKSGRYPDTLHFARYIQSQGRSGYESPSHQDNVRIMTVHGAKGLEAPVVFLVDTHRKLVRKKSYRIYSDWSDTATSKKSFMMYPRSTERGSSVREIDEKERALENGQETNLLYVAMTRARQYLVISGNQVRKPAAQKAAQEESLVGATWYELLHATFKNFGSEAHNNPVALPSTHDMSVPSDMGRSAGDEKNLRFPLQDFPPSLAQTINPYSAEQGNAVDFEDAVQPRGYGTAYGTVFHRTLELLAENKGANTEQIQQQINQEFPQYAEQVAQWWADALELYRDEALRPLFENERYLAVYNEMPLLYTGGDGDIVSGAIDRLCVGDDEVWIVDYKTHRVEDAGESTGEDADIDKLAKDFETQMYLYVQGVKKLFPDKSVRASVLFTAIKKIYDYRF